MNILSKDILPLKTSQKFSSVLEPYAGKVASTVLRRGCHCEVMFLSDYIQIKANTDTKGIDAKIAPINELLFESSDIPTIKIAEIKTFIM
jgi:hypothetical protein